MLYCKGCHRTKTPDDFYKCNKTKCIECVKEAVRKNYRRNRDHYINYERERCQRPERKKKALEYQRRRRNRFPEKNKARAMVTRRIRSGTLKRQPCEICGNPNSQAHHDDYSRPLDVRWLCFKHHREAHGQTVAA